MRWDYIKLTLIGIIVGLLVGVVGVVGGSKIT